MQHLVEVLSVARYDNSFSSNLLPPILAKSWHEAALL
jgi:hypothetical protein